MNTEHKRLESHRRGDAPWKKWGPYLSERQWGTVREDYSADGNAWQATPHDHARSKAYRWGEEGLAGISDDQQRICFALALWNGCDPILKERLFGLTGPEGNHGEDVKEYYYYLDSTPTHSWMQMLYKYPQQAFPYDRLVAENRRRNKHTPEFELCDTGVFDQNRYFDVFVSYAKAAPEDLLICIEVHNRGPETAALHLLPTLWFRNTWAWGYDDYRPQLEAIGQETIRVRHRDFQLMHLYCEQPDALLFCDNETNCERLYNEPGTGYYKDGIHDHLLAGRPMVNPDRQGTKASAHYCRNIAPGQPLVIRLRLGPAGMKQPFADFDAIFAGRQGEADAFYAQLQAGIDDDDHRRIQRQAFAGMLWSKQYYYLDIPQWLSGDPGQPPPPPGRHRNREWPHLNNADIISMPDKWEYPWYAAWDLAFHCVPLVKVDPDFAKEQLMLFTREWYMHPNGQLPAYEWKFSDVNPPVHAWAAWKVYQLEQQYHGRKDRAFLEEIFHKLLLNFTWWVNRKDHEGNNIFQGGFLGLDNIGVFDRSAELPTGGYLEQADATSWMAMYSLNLLRIALELAQENPVYQGVATKFFEHFLYIAGAMVNLGSQGISLWDEEDEFFYDVLNLPSDKKIRLKVRSLVGLIPLFAVEVLDHALLETVPDFTRRMDWFLNYRPDLAGLVSRWREFGRRDTHLLSLLRGHRMKCLLRRMLDETEFLSDYGVRGLSKQHQAKPYTFHVNGHGFTVAYTPAESDTMMFGGNSNWRGPVWFPVNYLLIESMRSFHRYYGDDFKIEYPSHSGQYYTIRAVADELARRLLGIFARDATGRRPVFGDSALFQDDPHFRDYLLFYEYFHGDNGRGVGASHQTGWTGLVASLIAELYE
ncbi:MAG: glucosidase [Bacteroidia bacterium]